MGCSCGQRQPMLLFGILAGLTAESALITPQPIAYRAGAGRPFMQMENVSTWLRIVADSDFLSGYARFLLQAVVAAAIGGAAGAGIGALLRFKHLLAEAVARL